MEITKTIQEIQEEFAQASEEEYEALYQKYQKDCRKGVKSLKNKYLNIQEKL